jgi:hypothetical protein
VGINKYGLDWADQATPLDIEFWMARKGDAWLKSQNSSFFFHFREIQKLLWPKDDHHRWSDLILKTYCEEEITVIMGSSDSSKTWSMAKIILVDYWLFPDHTLWLVSTTEGRGSELRIWGVIKNLFNQARQIEPLLEGNPIDHLKTITTEDIDEQKREARSLRTGIIIIPCKTGGVISGLAPYIGIKAPRLRHAGDEVPAMSDSFLNAYANWYGKEEFKGIMSGNFMETDDPLGLAAEPLTGWDSFQDTGKTQAWRSKFYNAAVIALDGRDSPNFDFVTAGRARYPYLIGPKKLSGVSATYGTDSWQWYSQCVGKPARGMDIWRVFTRDFCAKHHASDEVIWKDDARLQLYSLDPAYGGGDRCVGRRLELGLDYLDKQILFLHPPELVPIRVNLEADAEEQIAQYIHQRTSSLGIKPSNIFYDSFGRGTLGYAFARRFGADCPIPIDSGMRPTKRPVRFDLFVEEAGVKRLKRCDEHYVKFVTELWFSTREAIDSEQIRGLDSETIREGCARKFSRLPDSRLELETKDDYKERNRGRSCDLMDCTAIGIEGARQRGLRIEHLGEATLKTKGPDWLEKEVASYEQFKKSRQLQMA